MYRMYSIYRKNLQEFFTEQEHLLIYSLSCKHCWTVNFSFRKFQTYKKNWYQIRHICQMWNLRMVNFDKFWGLKFVLKFLMLIVSDVWRIGKYSSHLWRTGATFSRVWRLGTNSSYMWRLGTNSSHIWRIRWKFLTCKELVSIHHTCDLCFLGVWRIGTNFSYMCGDLVPIPLTCEELVPIPLTCEEFMKILLRPIILFRWFQ